jgi:capsule biosynthesis phosphatase
MIEQERMLVVDVDGTLAGPASDGDYRACAPNAAMIDRLRELRAAGWKIALATSRNMRTHDGNIGRINAQTLPVLLEWLREHDIPFDELHVGKPWPGRHGFYVDDRAIRPGEFLNSSLEEIAELLQRDSIRCWPEGQGS